MSCKPCNVKPGSKRGFSSYCRPENGVLCLSSTKWCDKYHYSKDQLRTLLRKRLIKGTSHKGTFYVEDREPGFAS